MTGELGFNPKPAQASDSHKVAPVATGLADILLCIALVITPVN
jgi:hypothetical protein